MAALEILTDEAIIDYTRKGNKNFIITDHRDFNARYSYLKPVRGGVYDPEIFGSAYSDRCYCGKIRTISNEPCPECDAMVLKPEDALRRFARIELPFYYLNSLRFDVFKEFMDDLFSGSRIITNFSNTAEKLGYNSFGSRKLTQKVYDSCQFEYDPVNKELTITDIITDEAKCSYEGLMKIIEDNFPDRLIQYKEFINRLYLILPSYMRPPSFAYHGRNKKISFHKLTIWYEVILRVCCAANRDAKSANYVRVMNSLKTPGERVKYTALLRAMLSIGSREATELLNTSKKNLARGLYAVRVKNSMRCPIVPSTDLPIDQVRLPRHLAYEICRSGFMKYIMEKYNFSEEEAQLSTRLESMKPEMQQEFTDYVEGNESKGLKGQCCIINRPPSLHKHLCK